ncbi:MAG: acetyl-CoA hydrolase/transferase family protein [Flavobacteriales bacterium]|nr:acetyl-CoA hydrolase/transferase family protein [Flavobacteriales bacterium]
MSVSAENAVKNIKSGDCIFIHSAAAAPQELIRKLFQRKDELRGVTIYQIHTEGIAPYADEAVEAFTVKCLFVGPNIRKSIQRGHGSYIPVFLSEIPRLFRDRILPIDVALISVSPPDEHGFCSLGPSVDVSLAAVLAAKTVIAQVNKYIPRTHGDGLIHINNINHLVRHNEPIAEVATEELSASEVAIGRHIAELVEDGATLQMGIGNIPNAVLASLNNHKDLGIHTEMFSDGILPLVEKGVITGKYKKKHQGKIVSSFVMGTRAIYDFIDDNPLVNMLSSEYVNNTRIISQNPKVTAINSAIEVDITGQVCADSIGHRIYSGVGGQMDFIRGASLSEGGKPIIALPSTTKRGESKIVLTLKPGAGVVTTRAHVHYLVTEFGAVNLYGKTLEERAKLLIRIAHPQHREQLERDWHAMTK